MLVIALSVTATSDAVAKHSSQGDVRAAFSKLQRGLRHSRRLTAVTRRELLATSRKARTQQLHHHPCRALGSLEELRIAIRRAHASHVGGVSAVELAIVGTASGAHCAVRSRHVRIRREPPIVGGPLKPEKRVKEKRDENEGIPPPAVRLRNGIDPGPATTITPASASPADSPFGFSTLTDVGSPTEPNEPEEPSQATAGKVVWYTEN